jgi:hypothetical protein
MKLGTNDIGSVYLGSNAVQKVYLGTNEVWSAFSSGLLDTYSGAAAAYSLRRLSISYTGSAIEVRRASDNSTQDIGFSGEDLDIATLESFCSGTNGFVTTWYDQSGNGRNATQTTAANQPQIVSSGSVITENGKPAIEFDSINDELSLPRFTYSQLSVIGISKTTSVGANNSHVLAQTNGFLLKSGQSPTNFPRFQPYDTGYKTAEYEVNSLNTQLLLFGYTSSGSANIYVNSNVGTTGSISTLNNPNNDIFIGKFPTIADSGNDGPIQEVIIYASDQSSNRTGIEDNINDFYSIY